MEKQVLIDAVIEDLKKNFELGDYTVLDELLSYLPTKNLVAALPEEDWSKFSDVKDEGYFEIMAYGYNKDLQREEIQIHCGENGNLFIIKTDIGFTVDVYNQMDFVDSMPIYHDDLDDISDIEIPDDFSQGYNEHELPRTS